MIIRDKNAQCESCNNFRGYEVDGGSESSEQLTCRAYRRSIPSELYFFGVDFPEAIIKTQSHTEPFKGDNGIRFEPIQRPKK